MSHVVRSQLSAGDQTSRGFSDGRVSPHEALRSPETEIQHCLLEAQRESRRLEAIVHQLAAAIHRDGLPSYGAVALFRESNRQLKRDLDEFTLDTIALLSILRST